MPPEGAAQRGRRRQARAAAGGWFAWRAEREGAPAAAAAGAAPPRRRCSPAPLPTLMAATSLKKSSIARSAASGAVGGSATAPASRSRPALPLEPCAGGGRR